MPPISSKTTLNDSNLIDALREIFVSLSYDPDNLTVENKTDVANRLSQMVNKEEPWGWRYIHNVLGDKIRASRELVDAINRLGASIDGAPDVLAKASRVNVLAVGVVQPGSLILADSRRCKNPSCGLWFVPTAHNQRYHSLDCKRAWEREYKRLKRQEQHGH